MTTPQAVSTAIEHVPSALLTTPEVARDPIATMLEAVVAGGVTSENVAAIEKLADLYERMQTKRSEQAFAASFSALQAELPVIVASTPIPNRGKYERFEDVMRVVSPLLAKHGFSISFSMDSKDGRVVETCHLRHVGGHSQSNSFAVRVGRADTETQADCKAATTAKRNALLNALNIVIRQDAFTNEESDAAIEGEVIDSAKVQYLKEQVAETNSDAKKFLALAGVERFEDIRAGSYEVLVRALAAKARK